LQVGNTHATRRAMLFKNLNYILREIYDILSEDALNYPVYLFIFFFVPVTFNLLELSMEHCLYRT